MDDNTRAKQRHTKWYRLCTSCGRVSPNRVGVCCDPSRRRIPAEALSRTRFCRRQAAFDLVEQEQSAPRCGLRGLPDTICSCGEACANLPKLTASWTAMQCCSAIDPSLALLCAFTLSSSSWGPTNAPRRSVSYARTCFARPLAGSKVLVCVCFSAGMGNFPVAVYIG